MLTGLRLVVRPLLRRWVVSSAVILTLAVGLAVSGALFVIVDGVLLTPFAVREPNHLFVAAPESPFRPGRPGTVKAEELEEFSRVPGVESVSGFTQGGLFAEPYREEESLRETQVEGRFFETLGVGPVLGRTLQPAEAVSTDPRPIVIGFGLWSERFGRSPDVLGRVTALGGRQVQIVGVMPRGFDVPDATNVWLLKPPSPPSSVRMASITPIIRIRTGRLSPSTRISGEPLVVETLKHSLTPTGGVSLAVLFASALLTLVIAWVHLGMLQMGLVIDEWRWISLRTALGSSRLRVACELVAQCSVLTGVGAVVAYFALPTVVAGFVAILPPELTRGQPIATGARSLSYLIALTVLGSAALAFGPILLTNQERLLAGLRGQSRVVSALGHRRLRALLLGTQTALVTALLYLSGMSIHHAAQIERAGLGVDCDRTMAITLPGAFGEADSPEGAALLDRLRRLSFVSSVAPGRLPLQPGRLMVSVLRHAPTTLQEMNQRNAAMFAVFPDYFRTLGIRALSGAADMSARPDRNAVYVSEALARALQIGPPRVGDTLYVDGLPARLAGVVSDVRADTCESSSRLIYAVSPGTQTLVVATKVPVRDVSGDIVRLVQQAAGSRGRVVVALGPNLAARLMAPVRSCALLLGLLALTALMLAVAGVFSITSESVRRARRETAIRLALGASPGLVVRNQVSSLVRSVAVGVLVGIALGVAAARLASSMVPGLSGLDPLVSVVVPVLLLVVGAVSAIGPAVHALRADVVGLLRAEWE